MQESLGQRLRRYRRAFGLTFSELSRQTGIAMHSLSDYEKDKTAPRTRTLLKLADFYGVAASELLTGAPVGVSEETLTAVGQALSRLTVSQQREVLRYARQLADEETEEESEVA